MSSACTQTGCNGCPIAGRIVCRCLQVTEEAVIEAVTTLGLRTVHEVRQHTGAGEGCTACRRRISEYLERYASSSSSSAAICSAR